jgi:hypothetical protein
LNGRFRWPFLTRRHWPYHPQHISACLLVASTEEYRDDVVDMEHCRSSGSMSLGTVLPTRVLVACEDGIPPPRRFLAGTDEIGTAEQKIADLQEQINENRDISSSLAYKK